MSKVSIVTDSAITIDPALIERLDVTIVPLVVRVGDREYIDGEDLNREELLRRMAEERVRPQIVGPTAQDFRHVYNRLTRRTDQIISLHSSAGLSAICQEAQKAADEFLGRCDIVVMDSETVSLGLGVLVEKAARLAARSLSLHEILRHIRGLIPRIYIVLITNTMDYLEHSGLISPSQAILGTMLGIRPFLAIEEGNLIPMEKVRSRERAIDKLAEFAGEFSHVEWIAVLQSIPSLAAETKGLLERLNAIAPGHEFPILLYGPLLASHIGPDGMGLIVYEGVNPRLP
ncbi:MAG TPA: DegV family protein [Anaerolineae bacterium]|nr:DegV family protein [Anaerolineae bacterium]